MQQLNKEMSYYQNVDKEESLSYPSSESKYYKVFFHIVTRWLFCSLYHYMFLIPDPVSSCDRKCGYVLFCSKRNIAKCLTQDLAGHLYLFQKRPNQGLRCAC